MHSENSFWSAFLEIRRCSPLSEEKVVFPSSSTDTKPFSLNENISSNFPLANKHQRHYIPRRHIQRLPDFMRDICISDGIVFLRRQTFARQNVEANKEIIALVQRWLDEKEKTFLLNCAYSNLLFDTISKFYPLTELKTTSAEHIAIKFIDYIENNYRSDISLETMAKHFGYTKEYCSKMFNKTVGQHFNIFLNSIRIKKVEEIMNSPDGASRKITDVIYECGFNNPVTFYRHYKSGKKA